MPKPRVFNATNCVGIFILLVMLLGVASMCGGYGIVQGIVMQHSSKYSEASLHGLTRDEVLHRLGKPSFDNAWTDSAGRSTTTRPWDESTEGPYSLAYYSGSGTCVIDFKAGRVFSVRFSMK